MLSGIYDQLYILDRMEKIKQFLIIGSCQFVFITSQLDNISDCKRKGDVYL